MPCILKKFIAENSFDVPAIPSPSSPASLALPVPLIIAPGNYHLGAFGPYDCFEEAFYRFWVTTVSATRIVYGGDVARLMGSLAWCRVDGSDDASLSYAQLSYKASSSKLHILCGPTAYWVKSILDGLGIQNRIANCLTAETPTGFYDGHVMNEVEVNGQWVLFDLPHKCTFNNLSLKDALPLQSTTPRIKLAGGIYYAAEPSAGFEELAWHENTQLTEADREAQTERVLQMPGITDANGHIYFYIPDGLPDRTAYITGLQPNHHVMQKADWLAKYYP